MVLMEVLMTIQDYRGRAASAARFTGVSRRTFFAQALTAGALCAAAPKTLLACETPPPPTTTSTRLKYAPNIVAPLKSGYSTITLSGTGPGAGKSHTINLAYNQHARIVLPNTKWVGQLNIFGNGVNTIHIIGGWLSNPWTAPGAANHVLVIRKVRRVYLEGLRLDKEHFAGDALAFSAIDSTDLTEAWVQNTLITGVNYMDTGGVEQDPYSIHGDFIQLQSQTRGLYIDKVTAYYWSQGLVFNQRFANTRMSGPAVVNGIHMSRFNCLVYDSNKNPKRTLIANAGAPSKNHKAFFFSDACSYTQDASTRTVFKLSQVYAEDMQRTTDPQGGNRRKLGNLCAPWMDSYSGCAGVVSGDPYTGRYTHSLIMPNGYVTGGIPPEGDFVYGGTLVDSSRGPIHKNAFNGLNYLSPGYIA
jgi:hypothetical protein